MENQKKQSHSVQRKPSFPKDRDILLERIIWSLVSVILILGLFFIFIILLKYVLKISFSVWLYSWLGFWIVSVAVFLWLIRNQKFTPTIQKAHFGLFILQLLVLTIILHYIGGIESFGVLFYSFFIVYGIFLLPQKYGLIIVSTILLLLIGLAFMEYGKILPHYNLFPGQQPYEDIRHVSIRLFMAAATFILLFFITNRLSETMRTQSEDLLEVQTKLKRTNVELKEKLDESEFLKVALEDTKATLEIRVEARTKELERLTGNLEGEVKQRTKELQLKVKELERFQKFAVGREIKMVELKKEIKKLKTNERSK